MAQKTFHALIFLLTLATATATSAIIIAEHELPDTWKHESKTLLLNGAGVREYSFLKIHIYVAALYLEKREANAARILAADTPRVIHLKMLREVNAKDSATAWQLYMEKNCVAPCQLNADAVKQFLSWVTDAKVGDTQTYIFAEQKLSIAKNNKPLGEIKDANFARTVLATWIGAVPTTEALRSNLLGAANVMVK